MDLFYAPEISSDHCVLSEEESAHCLRVMRMKIGDEMLVTDGKGSLYKAVITGDKKNACELLIGEKQQTHPKSNCRLHIAIAPTKNNERMEWFAEKAVEIGIDKITPLICSHSERRIFKTERLKKVVLAAMKQSFRTWLPDISEPVAFNEFLKNNSAGKKLIAKIGAQVLLKNILSKNEDALILIGPEGDFSSEELIFAKENGFTEVSLGDFRLRTETAALVACQTFNLINS